VSIESVEREVDGGVQIIVSRQLDVLGTGRSAR